MSDSHEPNASVDAKRGPVPVLAVVIGAAVVLVAGLLIWALASSDDDGASDTTTSTTGGGVVELPQDPSLALIEEDGVWYVENDGNVTMSDVVVSDDVETLCELGTLAPGDRQPCDGAAGRDDLVVTGHGPQGQPVQAGSD